MAHIARNSSVALLACLVLSGCGGGEPEDRVKVVPVSGTVVYQGNPVANARVAFWAEGAPKPATGTTGADGKFTLSFYDVGDGAMPGENKVVVTKSEGGAAAAPASDPDAMLNNPQLLAQQSQAQNEGGNESGGSALPAKYSNQETTDITVTVKDGDNDPFIIELID